MQRNDVEEMMNRTTFIEAGEAKQLGLCDDLETSAHANTKYLRREKAQNNLVSYFKQCEKILNKYYTQQHNNTTMPAMLKITAQLGLHEAAAEQHIADAIKEIQNRAYAAETQLIAANRKADEETRVSKKELDKLKADMEDLEAKLKARQKEYEDCKNKLALLQKDKDDAEEQAKEEKAKNMVTQFALQGRIKNEAAVINKWVNLAKADFDGTREMIEAIPLNKEAVKIPGGTNAYTESFTNAIALSARVMNNVKARQGR
jgi:hypothetical protein